jgi:peptidoglycan/LPS O-acetylase OafA/YrhL
MNLIWQLPNFASGILAYHVFIRLRQGEELIRKTTAQCFLAAGLLWWISLYVFDWPLNPGGLAWRALLSAPFPLLVLAFALYPFRLTENRLAVFFGSISYGVYLIHPLVIQLANPTRKALYAELGDHVGVAFSISLASVMLTTIALAYCSFRYLEAPFMRLGRASRRSRQAPVQNDGFGGDFPSSKESPVLNRGSAWDAAECASRQANTPPTDVAVGRAP